MAQDIAGSPTRGVGGMTKLVTGDRLMEAVSNGTFIQGGIPAGVEGVKYDFHMGSRLRKASYKQAIDIDHLSELERSGLAVEPGEVVFVCTKERIVLPGNMIALLVPKRKIAHNGIIILGGFSVDPNYSGPLWVGLYNYSSVSFPLKAGKKLIAAMFYELEGDELHNFPVPESSTEGDFPPEISYLINSYKPQEFAALQAALADTKKQLENLSAEFHDDKTWRRNFQDGLDKIGVYIQEQKQEIQELVNGLKLEQQARKQEDESLKAKFEREDEQIRGRLEGMTNFFATVKVSTIIIGTLIVAALGALAGNYIPKIMP